jgi:hypothetical protein
MPKAEVSNGRLDSWKDIAAYLGRDVRTAIRWGKEKGLPVRRIPGGKRQAVFAYTAELDSWLRGDRATELVVASQRPEDASGFDAAESVALQGSPVSASSRTARLKYLYVIAAATAVVLLLSVLGLHHRTVSARVPVRIGFTLNALQAFDDSNQLLWTYTFPGPLEPSALSERRPLSDFSYIGDFRGKGDREVLVSAPVRSGLNTRNSPWTEVDLFSSRGDLLWSYLPQRRFLFGKHEIDGPWAGGALFVSGYAGKPQIWAALSQAVWSNSFVVNLDPAIGKDTLRFVNTGTVRALNEITTSQGKFLLVAGFNNEADTGSLAIINEAKVFAASPQTEGTRHKCESCPAGDPDYYFEFPRSEINELEQAHEDSVVEVTVRDDQIQLLKRELNSDSGQQAIYYLLSADQGFRPVSVRFDSTYDMLHRKLEREGKLDHTLENCPERLHPRPIRVWTPAGGWTEVRLKASRWTE